MSQQPNSPDEKKPFALSVVLPAYNEEKRLPKTLISVCHYLDQRDINYEVIVVDDGSSDATAEIVQQFATMSSNESRSVKLLRYETNRGKGHAVRYGMQNCSGRLMLFNDSDGATPIKEIERLEAAIAEGADLAIGSRAMFSEDTAVKTVWYRKLMGRIFNGLVNFLVLPGIADTQCGFKLFTREAARKVFSLQTAERFSFDIEILFIALNLGYKIKEVPINWVNVPGSKVNLLRDTISMFRDVIRFRLKSIKGTYDINQDQTDS